MAVSSEVKGFYDQVQGRANVLHDYNVYNYNFTLVALSKKQVEDPATYQGKVISAAGEENQDFYIVARSGGFGRSDKGSKSKGSILTVNNNQPGIGTGPRTIEYEKKDFGPESSSGSAYRGGRDKDLFIDQVNFETLCGINNQGQSNLTRGQMQILEPHGVAGLYEELWAGSLFQGHENWIRAPFLLVITFVGRKAGSDKAEVPDKTTRYVPIMFSKSEMEIDESGARYNLDFLGFSAIGSAAPNVTLIEDTEAANVTEQSTAQSLLSNLFWKQNKHEEKRLDSIIYEIRKKGQTVQEIVADRKIDDFKLAEAGLGGANGKGSMRVEPMIPNKWCLWFAPDYGTFPSDIGKLSYSQWESNHQGAWDDNGTYNFAPYTNKFSGVNIGSLKPNNVFTIDSHEQKVEKKEQEIDISASQYEKTKGVFDGVVSAYEAKKKTLITTLKPYGIDLYEEKKNFPPRAPNNVEDIQNETAIELSKERRQLEDIIVSKVDLKNNTSTTAKELAEDLSYEPGVQTLLSKEDLAVVTTTLTELYDLQEKLIQYGNELANIEKGVKEVRSEIDDFNTTVYDVVGQGPGAFSFNKGQNLLACIDVILANSSYMKIFSDKAELDKIKASEYIPWYKVSIHTKIIGFDTFKMDFAYEYHFVIDEYDIHYSQFPGTNIIFSTERLKELAVREYNYIYTGKNLDVLKFDIKYNHFHFVPFVLQNFEKQVADQSAETKEDNPVVIKKSVFEQSVDYLNQGISNKLGHSGFQITEAVMKQDYTGIGSTGNNTQIAQTLQSFLYEPFDIQAMIRAELQIIGDPVYIIGSGIANRPILTNTDVVVPDTGEMNTFTREPDIIFNFKFPADLPSADELRAGKQLNNSNQRLLTGQYSGLYKVVKIENSFSEGVFTQNLHILRRRNQQADYVKGDPKANEGNT